MLRPDSRSAENSSLGYASRNSETVISSAGYWFTVCPSDLYRHAYAAALKKSSMVRPSSGLLYSMMLCPLKILPISFAICTPGSFRMTRRSARSGSLLRLYSCIYVVLIQIYPYKIKFLNIIFKNSLIKCNYYGIINTTTQEERQFCGSVSAAEEIETNFPPVFLKKGEKVAAK